MVVVFCENRFDAKTGGFDGGSRGGGCAVGFRDAGEETFVAVCIFFFAPCLRLLSPGTR